MDDEPGVQRIPVSDLHGDTEQPRHGEGDRRALEALKASMDELGRTVQYVTATPSVGGGFRIVSGHRRVQAARELGWDWLPVIVVDDVADDVDRQLRQIAENSARSALKPIELCEAIDRLRGRVEPPKIAGATGVSLRTVYNYLGILEHPDLVERLRAGTALRAVLIDVAARNQRPSTGSAPGGREQERGVRQAARRTARRSLTRLSGVWADLDLEHRRELADELRSLLASVDAQEPSSASATLHSSSKATGNATPGGEPDTIPARVVDIAAESPIEGADEAG